MSTEVAAAPAPSTNQAEAKPGPVVQQQTTTATTQQTKEAPQGAEAANPTGETQKPTAPEKYDLKLPDDMLLDNKHVERITSFAKENGLSESDAQDIVDRENEAVSEFIEHRKAEWKTQVENDKEIGGDGLKKNVELAKRVVDRFGSDTLRNELTRSGYGNHPELVRLLVRLGNAMKEDQLVQPSTQTTSKRSIEEIFYGSSQSQS